MALHISVTENYKKDLELLYGVARGISAGLGLATGYELIKHLKKNNIPHETHDDESDIPPNNSYYSFQ